MYLPRDVLKEFFYLWGDSQVVIVTGVIGAEIWNVTQWECLDLIGQTGGIHVNVFILQKLYITLPMPIHNMGMHEHFTHFPGTVAYNFYNTSSF